MSGNLVLYILKRVLVMVPTLFVIAVICFLVLNLAPGRPGQSSEMQQAAGSEALRQQQRIFKEFFNYDKPAFFNDYYAIEEETVRDLLETIQSSRQASRRELIDTLTRRGLDLEASDALPSVAQVLAVAQQEDALLDQLDAASLSQIAGTRQRTLIDVQYEIEDYGEYIVPHLITLLDAPDLDPRTEALIFEQLSINAQLRNLFLGREDDVPVALRDRQRDVGLHNQMISDWQIGEAPSLNEQVLVAALGVSATSAAAAASLAPIPTPPLLLGAGRALALEAGAERALERAALRASWLGWYAAQGERFNLDTGDKVERFFFDTRFSKYMGNLLRGDFGFTQKKEPVLPEILDRLKYSFTLSFFAALLTYLLSIPIGVYSAVRQHTFGDQVLTVVLFILYSLPSFFVGMLMVQYIPSGEPLFTSGFETSTLQNPYMTSGEKLWDIALHLVLPVICLTYGGLAALSRYARTGLLDVIRADYIRTARAKGLSEPVVIIKHAMRNGMIPILTILGTLLPVLFGGSIVIEMIFQIEGIGKYMLDATFTNDYAVIMAVLLISAAMTLVGLLISDISYALVDPRITFD